MQLDVDRPAYFQLCLFQDPNPRKARQLHFRRGSHSGTMKGQFQLPEETLRQDTVVTLEPEGEMDAHGEPLPGKGESEEI